MLDFTLTVNNTNLTNYIKYDSYETKKTPVFSPSVTTLDGVEHIAVVRYRGACRFEFNPQNAETAQTIAAALMTQPLAVRYYSLQTNQYEDANMKLDDQSAEYLAKCKFVGKKWVQIGKVTLEEL